MADVLSQPVDAQALALTHAIALQESGKDGKPNYNASGDAGTSKGAYQWQPGNFESAAKAAGLDPSDFSPENQDKVAYSEVKGYKEKGYDPGQIASLWNSGSPNNWQNHVGTTTINGQQVHYDTPAYVKGVQKYYSQLSSGPSSNSSNADNATYNPKPFSNPSGTDSGAGTFNFSSVSPIAPSQEPGFIQGLQQDLSGTNPQNLGTQAENTIKGVGNFLFPAIGDVYHDIKGDSTKTGLQQAGDVGLSALPFIPGLGEVGEAARGAKAVAEGADLAKSSGLLSKLTGTVGKNAAVGYGAGTASNLASGQSIPQALTPQLSNVGGAVLGGGTAGLLSKLAASNSDQAVISKLQKVYEDALGATKTGVKASSKVTGRGAESPAGFLANAGISPETEDVNGRTIFKTGEDSNTYRTIQQRANALTGLRDKLIDTASNEDLGDGLSMSKAESSLGDLKTKILDQVQKQFYGKERAQATQHVEDEFGALTQQFGGEDVSLKDLNTVKKYFQGNSNYDTTRPSTLTQTNKLAATVAREQVEKDAEKAKIPGIKQLNAVIRQHLDFLNSDGKKGILDKLNGQVVKGGRIGTHVKEGIGGAIGLAASHAVGGGFLGDLVGGIGGGIAGNRVSRLLQHFSVGGSSMAARVGKIAQEDPELIEKLVQNLKDRGTHTSGLVAPRLVPKGKSTGILQNLATKTAARVGASL